MRLELAHGHGALIRRAAEGAGRSAQAWVSRPGVLVARRGLQQFLELPALREVVQCPHCDVRSPFHRPAMVWQLGALSTGAATQPAKTSACIHCGSTAFNIRRGNPG